MVKTATYAALCEAIGADFAAELLGTFLSEAPQMITTLKTAVDEKDADGYRRAAHSIKSNAEIFGATALADVSRQMKLTGLCAATPPVGEPEMTWSNTEMVLKALSDE
ncbi:MAG: Hpt domain-containing protein [Pseudomonadota bacterium]